MKPNPQYFIELIKSHDGSLRELRKNDIKLLKWSLEINKKFGIETVAIFKIYPKYAKNNQ